MFECLGGAVGRLHSPHAYAEIEGEESEVISIDVPVAPERDLIATLKQTTAVPMDLENLCIKSFYVSVEEEHNSESFYGYMSEHVSELMQEYESRDDSQYQLHQIIIRYFPLTLKLSLKQK